MRVKPLFRASGDGPPLDILHGLFGLGRNRHAIADGLAAGSLGPANGRIQLVAQGEMTAATTIDANAASYSLRRFSQGRGFIRPGGANLAGVTGGSLTFSNNLERVRVIREDGKIEAADPTFASAQGTMGSTKIRGRFTRRQPGKRLHRLRPWPGTAARTSPEAAFP